MIDRRYVCVLCVNDEDLQETIRNNSVSKECSFCGRRSRVPIAADLSDVVEHIRASIESEYDLAADWLPYESAEGGYQGEYWDTADLLTHEIGLDLPNDRHGSLLSAIVDAIGMEDWCNRDPFTLTPRDKIRYDWRAFSNLIKHKKRYFFLDETSSRTTGHVRPDESLSPSRLLSDIIRYAHECHLFVEYPIGFTLHRARGQWNGRIVATPEELGPPPEEKATQANRMSPAGIVMFYGSLKAETAVAEISKKPGPYMVGLFKTIKPVTILDLSKLPPAPSFFYQLPDSVEYDPTPALRFLNALSRKIALPIAKDRSEHIEYVPTQVVTEYIRTKNLPGSQKASGIVYPSAAHRGGFSAVLFATQQDILGTRAAKGHLPGFRDPWLKLSTAKIFPK